MSAEYLTPAGLPPAPTYTHVVKSGNTVYVAGQTAQDEQGNIVGKGDPGAQAEQVLKNLQTALAAAGGNLGHLVKTTVYVTDARYREAVAAARAKYLKAPFPASTFVVCAGLASPDYLIEIEGIAVID